MSTSCKSTVKVKEKFDKFFDKSGIKKISISSGFQIRKPKKISGYNLVFSFLLMCSKGKNTFAEWAVQIGFISGTVVSRQGVWDRINENASQFAESLLRHFFLKHSGLKSPRGLFSQFGKVLLQDSTVIKLPDSLASVYAGSTVGGKQRSQVRIQTIIDVKRMHYHEFTLSGFTSNDQSASGQIMQFAKKGDLVIRDLGYFALQTFQDMLTSGVHFVSRLRYGLLLKTASGKDLDLLKLLKKGKLVDMKVFIGAKQIPVRLVMLPLPKSVAEERIRKAKCDRDKRLNHTPEYYMWLRYNVLITSLESEIWSPQQIAEIYRLRWQIEIIFKSWKSGAGMHQLLHERVTDADRVKVVIYLLLLFMCLFNKKIFNPMREIINKKSGKELSLIKAINYVMKNIVDVIACSTFNNRKNMTQHCCYDLRTKRKNLPELFNNFTN